MNKLTPEGYSMHQVSRKGDKGGGGVAVVYKNTMGFAEIPTLSFTTFEYLDAKFKNPGGKPIRMVVLYRPPMNNTKECEKFLKEFANLVEVVILDKSTLIITADFNYHVDNINDADAASFLSLLKDLGLHQHVKTPTHEKGHILDLILTRESESLVRNIEID